MFARLSLAPDLAIGPDFALRQESGPGPPFSVTVHDGLDALAVPWAELVGRGSASPYQDFALLAAWCRHAAPGAGVLVRPGVVRDAQDRVAMILPFGVVRRAGARQAVYLGGTHSNLNQPLADPALSAGMRAGVLRQILADYGRLAGADLVALERQPLSWSGRAHVFAGLPRQASFRVPLIRFDGDFAGFFQAQLSRSSRHKVRGARSALSRAGKLRTWEAGSPAEITRILDVFAGQKAARLTRLGVDDPFAAPGVLDFLREAAETTLGQENGFKLHALELDGEILATGGGIVAGDQFSWMISSYEAGHPHARHSPGMVLLAWSLETRCGQGIRTYDFGVGEEGFKDQWCNEAAALFDTVLAFTPRGWVAASVVKARTGAVRAVKSRPALFRTVKLLRAQWATIRQS